MREKIQLSVVRYFNDNALKVVHEKSDNECATLMQKAKTELFKNLSRHKLQLPTTYAYNFGLIS